MAQPLLTFFRYFNHPNCGIVPDPYVIQFETIICFLIFYCKQKWFRGILSTHEFCNCPLLIFNWTDILNCSIYMKKRARNLLNKINYISQRKKQKHIYCQLFTNMIYFFRVGLITLPMAFAVNWINPIRTLIRSCYRVLGLATN